MELSSCKQGLTYYIYMSLFLHILIQPLYKPEVRDSSIRTFSITLKISEILIDGETSRFQ